MDLRAERGDGIPRGAVPVHGVRFEAVVGREIEAATEPPDRRGRFRTGEENRTLAWLVGT